MLPLRKLPLALPVSQVLLVQELPPLVDLEFDLHAVATPYYRLSTIMRGEWETEILSLEESSLR